MDIKKFVLSYYKNAMDTFHIQRVYKSCEAEKLHMHNYFQIYYIIRGQLTHYIGNSAAFLSKGDVFIIPPKYPHHIMMGTKDTAFYSVSFSLHFFRGSDNNNTFAGSLLQFLQKTENEKIQPKITISAKEQTYIELLMNRIMEEFTLQKLGSIDIMRSNMMILLTLFARIYFNNSPEHISIDFESNKQSVLYCIDYINKNYTENIKLSDIAKRSTMSKTIFCDLFAKLTGYPFKQYLNKLRIEKSADLIKNNHKINHVAILCGYSDFSTFYRNFKKFTGVSPNQYKKINIPKESCILESVSSSLKNLS